VDLGLQVLDALREVAAFRMSFRMPGADQAEPAAPAADELDQLGGVAESASGTAKARIRRDVAPEGHHVLDAVALEQGEDLDDLVARGFDARDVRRALDAEPADARHQIDGRFARLAAGAGHRNERGPQRPKRLD